VPATRKLKRTAPKRPLLLLVLLAGLALPAASANAAAAPRRAQEARRHCVSSAAARAVRRHARACRSRTRRSALDGHGATPHAAKTPKPIKTRSSKRPRSEATPLPAAEASASQATPTAHAAAIAAVLSTPCQNTELTPEAANLPLVRAAILCLINVKRAENGESPLKPNADLEAAAEGHCQELIADDYFAHVSPSGETPVDRIRETGYIPSPSDGYVIGENLAWGTYQLSTPEAIASAWFASPGHLANILEAQYTETGIGVIAAVPASLAGGAPGATYGQEFGVIIP